MFFILAFMYIKFYSLNYSNKTLCFKKKKKKRHKNHFQSASCTKHSNELDSPTGCSLLTRGLACDVLYLGECGVCAGKQVWLCCCLVGQLSWLTVTTITHKINGQLILCLPVISITTEERCNLKLQLWIYVSFWFCKVFYKHFEFPMWTHI